MAMNIIPIKNLKLMSSDKDGGMLELLSGESIGGNAGSHNGFLCAGANFYFGRDTGLIILFTNDVLRGDNLSHGVFRIVSLSPKLVIEGKLKIKNMFFKIVEWQTDNINKFARENIEKSIALYNEKYKIEGID